MKAGRQDGPEAQATMRFDRSRMRTTEYGVDDEHNRPIRDHYAWHATTLDDTTSQCCPSILQCPADARPMRFVLVAVFV